MKLKEVVFAFIYSFIIAGILVYPLFATRGQETTFDGPTHMQTIAQFTQGLQDGQFPVRWGAGFARHGMPIPLVAQQSTSYLGALFNLVTHDVVLSYRLVVFVGAWLSVLLMYVLLRMHVGWESALFGSFLFNVAPYRIANIYIRGALPEFFANIPILLTLIGMNMSLQEGAHRRMWGVCALMLGIAGLLLTHPFVAVISVPLLFGYGLYLVSRHGEPRKIFMHWGVAAILGGLISVYYVLPLLVEIRYFNYAQATSHFVENNFLPLSRFFVETWHFFGPDIATRGNILQGGFLEGVVLMAGIVFAGVYVKRTGKHKLMVWIVGVALVYLVSMMSVSRLAYVHTFLDGIQHPWRMLTGYIVAVPLLAGLVMDRVSPRCRFYMVIVGVCLIAWMRFPQLYTKNARHIDQKNYYMTDENTHGLIMNTVWMGDARTYPYQREKGSIIGGVGKLVEIRSTSVYHNYNTWSDEPLRVLDYTFYFPGWKAYVDGQLVPIQFQDPSYRGLITFDVPAGEHIVEVVFEKTKVRVLAEIISIMGLGGAIGYLWHLRRANTY